MWNVVYMWLSYQLPWWLQAALLAVLVGLPLYLVACMIFGTATANRYVVLGIIAITTLGLASRFRQEGYRQRIDEEEKAADKAEDIAEEERREAERLPDDQLNGKVDKWSRH